MGGTSWVCLNYPNNPELSQSYISYIMAHHGIMACFFGQLPLDRQGFGPGELSNALASALRPADAFDCPDVQGPWPISVRGKFRHHSIWRVLARLAFCFW